MRLLSYCVLVVCAYAAVACGSGEPTSAPADTSTYSTPPTEDYDAAAAASSDTSTPPVVRHRRPVDHKHDTSSMDFAFKVLDAYGLDPSNEAVCWWEHSDKRSQSHWHCHVGASQYTVHITAEGNPVNYVMVGPPGPTWLVARMSWRPSSMSRPKTLRTSFARAPTRLKLSISLVSPFPR